MNPLLNPMGATTGTCRREESIYTQKIVGCSRARPRISVTSSRSTTFFRFGEGSYRMTLPLVPQIESSHLFSALCRDSGPPAVPWCSLRQKSEVHEVRQASAAAIETIFTQAPAD